MEIQPEAEASLPELPVNYHQPLVTLNPDASEFFPRNFTTAGSAPSEPKTATVGNKRRGPVVTGRVEGIAVQFLADTGAESTILSQKCFKTLPKAIRQKFQDVSSNIIMADGSRVPTKGPVLCTIELGQQKILDAVFVADIEDYALLGWETQLALGVTYTIAGVDMVNPTTRVRTVFNPVIRRVKAAEDVVIPARSEVIVPGVIEGEGTPRTTLISSSPEMEKAGVAVGKVLVNATRRDCPVRLLNPSEESKVVNKGDIIAGAEEVDELQSPTLQSPVNTTDEVPAHLKELYEKTVTEGQLEPEVAEGLKRLLIKHADVFAKSDEDLGRTNVVEHHIDTGDSTPIRQAPRRIPIAQQPECEKAVADMLAQGVIEPGQSPWASPVVLVRKKDGSLRFCVDYRKLNSVTKFDAYPLPRVDETLDTLAGAQWFSTLDLISGYWQVGLTPEAKVKSAFCVRSGLYLWRVMPFGLCNAPSTFERLMETVLQGLHWKECLVYLDDIVIFGRTSQELLKRMDDVFGRLFQAGLKIKPKKCRLFRRETEFLGHIISGEGVKVNPDKIAAIRDWPVPECVTELRSFLGTASYYRKFIAQFATIAAPLHELTGGGQTFLWTEACQEAFEHLKTALCSAPVLNFPVKGAKFILDTDASERGIGAVLSQLVPIETPDGSEAYEERVLSYASRTLSVHEKRYCTTRKELLAVVWFLRHYRSYLYGQEFLVRTDHSSLQWICNFWEPEGQIARWLQVLGEYNFKVLHRPGKQHQNADGLSRRGPCKQCHQEFDEPATEVKCPERLEEPIIPITRRIATNLCAIALTPEWTANQLAVWQEADDDLNPVISALKNGQLPTAKQQSGFPAKTKRCFAEWERLKLRGGVVYREWYNDKGEVESYQLLTPQCIRATILQAAHDDNLAGHFAERKTAAKVRRHFFWPGLAADVHNFCQSCLICQQRKPPPTRPHHPLQQEVIGEPLQRVTIDILGFERATSRGNKYILVIVDTLTKWAEALPMQDERAETVAKLLVEEFVCRYGIPSQLHSDQGRQFEAAVFQEMCALLQISKTRTTPLHPQSDGQTERLNRTILDLLAKTAADNPLEWDTKLPYAMAAYRSTPHTTTDETPNRLMLGREATTPLQLLTPPPPDMTGRTPWVEALHENFQEAQQRVLAHFGKEQRLQKASYDRRLKHIELEEGQRVWLAVKRMKKKGPYKLNPQRWEGPYEVRKRLSPTVYLIGKPGQKVTQIVNIARLVPVVHRKTDLAVPQFQAPEVLLPAEVEEQVYRQIPDQSSEETRPVERHQPSDEPSSMAKIPDMASPSQQAPVGFAPGEVSSQRCSRPTRQRRQPQRYGDVRRFSDYEDFE